MSNPVAAHTFDFTYIYLSTRTGGAPGSGVWTNPVVLFNGNTDPNNFVDATTMSAGSLSSVSGLLSQTDGLVGNTGLSFLGTGAPAAPQLITFTGQQHSGTFSSGYWNTAQGVWAYGGALYCAVVNKPPGGSGVPLVTILKSTDGSSPWAIQD